MHCSQDWLGKAFDQIWERSQEQIISTALLGMETMTLVEKPLGGACPDCPLWRGSLPPLLSWNHIIYTVL